jgi:S-adenosylmethionine hydrolase
MATIALLTDFGLDDGFVGMLKGTIKSIAPTCEIIDLSHAVDSFDVRSAAFLLERSFRHFPPQTVILSVVDPGVGSARRILAAAAGDYLFVAPDNGLLSYALAQFDKKRVYSVENSAWFNPDVTATFHGRDIMAPVAARLASGQPVEEVGPVADSYAILRPPNLLKTANAAIGEIMYVDKFGNLISNIKSRDLPATVESGTLKCSVGSVLNVPFVASYSEAKDFGAIISGFDTVEIFINQGSAAGRFAHPVGTTIAVEANV